MNKFYKRYGSAAELIKVYSKAEKEAGDVLSDKSLCSLAHPKRVRAHPMGCAEFLVDFSFDDINLNIIAPRFMSRVSTHDIWHDMEKSNNKFFRKFFDFNASGADGGFGSGSNGVSFSSCRFQMAGGKLFTIDDDLLDMLINTDISGQVPISTIKLPYPVMYLEFGKRHDGRAGYLNDKLTGEHPVEGVYLCDVKDSKEGRIIEVSITCAPNEKSDNAFDDHVEWLSMPIRENATIDETVASVHTMARNVSTGEEIIYPKGKHGDDLIRRHSEIMSLVMKCLLYINLPESRRVEVKDGTEAQMKIMRAVSGSHKKKAERAARKAHDYILIMPPADFSSDSKGEGSRSDISPHWRRGHFRAQRFGVGLSETKIIWISPVLVGFDEKAVVSNKDYVVKK